MPSAIWYYDGCLCVGYTMNVYVVLTKSFIFVGAHKNKHRPILREKKKNREIFNRSFAWTVALSPTMSYIVVVYYYCSIINVLFLLVVSPPLYQMHSVFFFPFCLTYQCRYSNWINAPNAKLSLPLELNCLFT